MSILTDDKVWEQFLEWLPSAEPSTDPGTLFEQYRSRLMTVGRMEGEVDGYLAVVANNMRTRSDGWRVMFNNIYASSTSGFSTTPNALLMATVEDRKPGRALEVGMGEGRNTVFLALKGWDVTGFEISDEGVAIAQRNARAAGVNIKTLSESNATFDFGPGTVGSYRRHLCSVPADHRRLRSAARPLVDSRRPRRRGEFRLKCECS